MFDLRMAVGKSTPLGSFCKFLLNSLTGKLGMKSERFEYTINPERIYTCICKPDAQRCNCNPHEQVGDYIYRRTKREIPKCAHPQWAAYLTAASRIKLTEMLRLAGDDALYCDTDSVFSLRKLESPLIGENIGQFQLNGKHDRMRIYAPKIYASQPGEKRKVKAKGMRKAPNIEIGKSVSWDTIAGFGTGARKGKLFTAQRMTRTLAISGGDRIIGADGITRPPHKG